MPVRLHRDMCVEVVKRAVRLFAPVPTTFIHALDFLVASARALVLLGARDGDEGVDGGEGVAALRV